MFWLMLLGIYMGWVETSPSKAAPDAHDWDAPLPKPPEYLRNTYEVTGTGDKADIYVRFMARSRR